MDKSDELELHRAELTGFCYRMLGSGFEAEDAVQETMLRAWRNSARFDPARSALRSWLYAIAANVCLDMLRSAQRRARAMDLGPAASAGPDLGAPLPEAAWIEPVPDSRVLGPSPAADPADLAVRRQSIRLAFVAALQQLPPRQRAIVILRDVLGWRATEVAGLLGTTTASVTSALQRARATLRAGPDFAGDVIEPENAEQRALLDRYCGAFERYDVEALVSLLREDAIMSMPPFPWWLHGRAEIGKALLAAGRPCEGTRLVPVAANGSPGFAQFRPRPDGQYQPFALTVLCLAGGQIGEITTFLDAGRLFPLFGLPATPGD